MKYLFLALLIASLTSKAQTSYDATISFNMSDTADEAGTVYKRKAFFESMTYNQRSATVSIQMRVKLFNAAGSTELKKLFGGYSREFYTDDNTFVVLATGSVVGNRATMRSLYGVVQTPATETTPTVWRQSVFGGDSLTTPCMGAGTYLSKLFDNQNKLSLIIKSLAIQAASDGKLN